MHKRFILLILTVYINSAFGMTTQWEEISPGLEYAKLPLPSISSYGKLHAFKINLQQYRMDLVLAKDYKKSASSAQKLARKSDAIIAINGGFFSPELKPLGLRIQNGRVRSHLKNTSWWGVFYINSNNLPHIVSQKRFRNSSNIEFAVQAGPRLVINNKIPNLRAGFAQRSALGITPTGEVVLVATENAPVSTTQLAEIMRRPEAEGGLACPNALNLDGGKSTQLYAKFDNFYLNIPNFSAVTDVIAIRRLSR